jgi:hypothetical protein
MPIDGWCLLWNEILEACFDKCREDRGQNWKEKERNLRYYGIDEKTHWAFAGTY